VDTVRARADIPHRWYAQKAAVLGLEKLADYDRMAPIVEAASDVDWAEGIALVLEALAAFSPELGSEARRAFDHPRIDAAIPEGKQCGGMCAPTVPSGRSYVLVNWAGQRRDVLILAHELGHAVHAALGASQGVFHHEPGLPLKETAAIFAETAVLQWLVESTHDRELRL